MLDKRKFFIDGQWVLPITTSDYSLANPATEIPCAIISLGSSADVDRAVAAARAAFPAYSALSLARRLELMENLISIYQRRSLEMAQCISTEMGAPITFASKAQAPIGEGRFKGSLQAAKDFDFESDLSPAGQRVIYAPIGVCGLITPWNWPMDAISKKCAPALLAGCTIVLKPSEFAPLSAMLLAEIIDEAGYPPGVFNLVNGLGTEVGEAMSRHPDIDMISFTGSVRGGTAVARAAAETVKRVTLELGGKSPNLVFDDADLARIVRNETIGLMDNSGQTCVAPTRMLVQRSVYDEAVGIAANAANCVRVGDPAQKGDHIGPVVSRAQFDRIQAYIETGIAEGAQLAAGGLGRPEGLNRGYYVRPTVFSGVNNQMKIAREEIFGPVLVMIPFEDEAEAIAIANDTPYGLAAYVQTADQARAERVARQLRAGIINLNGAWISDVSPFGGFKQSGNGRELGKWGLEDYLEVKAVSGWTPAADAV